MANLWEGSGQVLVDGNGAPYASWKLYTYETGTTTNKATYSDAGLTSANTNPVVADSNGRMGDVYLLAGRYKLVFKTSADVTIKTIDPYDSSSQLITATAAPSPTYSLMEYVNSTDGHRYRRSLDNTSWIDLGLANSLGNAATVAQVLAGTDTTSFGTPDSIAALWQRGTDIASATTLSLPSGGGGVFNITGTTTITGIGSAVGGRQIKVKFAGSCQLTHNSTSFILPGGTNIVTQAGDTALFINEAATDATGSNWRCFSYQYASGAPMASPATASKTASYTVTDADRGALIRFGGLSADATLTLPAASGRAGFILYVVNDDTADASPFGVTVDPNGAETIDGFTTRKGYTGTRVTILCDGSGWRTVAGNWRYFSGNQTISSAGTLTLAHGLGIIPQRVTVSLKCLTAELNYSVGDIVWQPFYDHNSTNIGVVVVPDATNLNVIMGGAANPFSLLNKTTGLATVLTNARWAVRFHASD